MSRIKIVSVEKVDADFFKKNLYKKEEELKEEIERATEYELIEKVKQELTKEYYGEIVRTCDAIDFQIFVKKALQIGFQQGKAEAQEEFIKIIDEYILTDIQGHLLPQCKILWEIKEKLKEKGK